MTGTCIITAISSAKIRINEIAVRHGIKPTSGTYKTSSLSERGGSLQSPGGSMGDRPERIEP